VAARVLHVSDLHIGQRDTSLPVDALRVLAARIEPDLVLATGDLANRGRREQLERAAEILGSLELPLLAVPGNHDQPYAVPARFTRTLDEWERVFGTAEPIFESSDLVVVGLSSVRPWRQQGGALAPDALERAAARLRSAPEKPLRVVALHHHLAAPPWRAARKRPLSGRDHVLRVLDAAGAELVVGGHVHQASVSEVREFRAGDGARRRSLVLATAPGLGRPRPRRLGEAQGAMVYESDADTLSVTTYAWTGDSFVDVSSREFHRN